MCLEFSVKISAQFNGQQTGNQRMKEDCSSCLVWFFSHGLSFSLESLSAQQCHLVFILEEADTVHLEAFLCCLFQLCGGPIIIWCGTTHNNSPLRYPNCNIWLCNYQNINQLFVYTVIQETNYWLWLRVCHAVDHSAYLLFFFIMVK